MNTNSGALSFEATIANSQFNSQIEDMQRRLLGLTRTADNEARRLDTTFSNLGRLAAGAFAVGGLSQLPGQIVQVRGEFQQLEIAFSTMLRSKGKADQLMADVVQLAAETPFGLKDAAQATKQLLAYGSASESVISELRMLGDVAAGVSVPIGDLTYLYGTLRSQGRAYAVDIRQFAGRGIPIYRELAEVLGVGVDKVNELVEQGKVGFPQVEKAFQNMTGEGGMFFNLMEKQSKSLTGLLSQLKDAIDVMFNNIGQSQEEAIGSAIKGTISLTQNYEQVASALTVLVSTYGAYKAAVVTVNAMRAVELTAAAAVSANVDRQSGSYAREIALKVKSAEATRARTAALAEEAFSQSLNAAAAVQSLRTEVSAAAAKKASAIESAKVAAADIASAEARLAAAQAHQAATAKYLNASVRSAAAKEVEAAQNALLSASEAGLAARKAASAASADFNSKKLALENAAKTANTLVTNTNATAAVASAAASNASAIASTRLTAVQGLQIAVTRQLAAAQAAFNATLLANPIVLTTTAIVALAGAVWYLSDGTTAAELAQRSLNEQQQKDNHLKDEIVAKTSKLTSVINDQNATTFQQIQAYRQLQQMYPVTLGNLSLHEFQLLKAEDAQKKFNAAIDQMQIANKKRQFDDVQKEIERLTKQLEDFQKQQQQAGPGGAGMVVPIEDTRKSLEKAKEEAKRLGVQIQQNEQDAWSANTPVEDQIKHYTALRDQLLEQRKKIEDSVLASQKLGTVVQGLKPFFDNLSLTGLNQQIDQVGAKLNLLMGKPNALFGGNKGYWEKIKQESTSKLEELGVGAKGSKEWNDLAKQIAEADRKLKAYDLTQKKVAEKDKPQPFGSIAYYEQVARKAQEIIDKTPESNVSKISEQTRIKNDAEKKAEDIRKRYATKSYAEELELKKQQYQLFQRWAENYGIASAKIQFASLVSENKTYVDYLNQEIAKLEAKKDGGQLNSQDANTLDYLNTERNDAIGKKSKMDLFNESLDRAAANSDTLTEELEKLRAVQEQLGEPISLDDRQMAQLVSERIVQVENDRKRLLQDFLVSVAGSEQRELAIRKRYAELREALDAKTADKKSDAYVKALKEIDKAEKEDLTNDKIDANRATNEFKAFQKIVQKNYTELKAIDVKQAREEFARLTEKMSKESDLYKEHYENLLKIEQGYNERRVEIITAIASAAGELGDIFSGIDGGLGNAGANLSALSAQISSMVQQINSISKAMKASDKAINLKNVGDWVGLVVQVVGFAVRYNKKVKQELATYVQNYQDFLHELAMAQNQTIGQSYNKNPFYTAYNSQIAAQTAQFEDAVAQYNTAVSKLSQGRAIVGYNGGFFKKDKNVYQGLLDRFPELVDAAGNLNVELAKSLVATGQLDEKTKALVQNAIDWAEKIGESQEKMMDLIVEMTGQVGETLADSISSGFDQGLTAAQAWGQAVGNIIQDVFKKTIIMDMLKPGLDKLAGEIKESYDPKTGDNSIVDDLERYGEYGKADYERAYAIWQAMNDFLDEKGFGDAAPADTSAPPTPQQGTITGASQEAINLLNGSINAMRILQADGVNVARSQLLELTAIRANTGATAGNTDFIRADIAEIRKLLSSDVFRAIGGI